MSLTPSNMLSLQTPAPAFTLPDAVSGKTFSLNALKGEKATVIMFICNHCPYVRHINAQLVKLALDYMPRGVKFIAINSNDLQAEPEDSPDNMKLVALLLKYPFPYLFDETQQVAKDYDAACTPDFFVFNSEMKLAYRGQLDDSRPSNNIPPTGKDLREALNHILSGQAVSPKQRPSIGCNIKWRQTIPKV